MTDFERSRDLEGATPEQLLARIDMSNLPRHVAIIMDGNGRWAKQRGLPRVAGHRAGIESVREVVEIGGRLGLEAMTLYAFSRENWSRPKSEVSTLMRLLIEFIESELAKIHEQQIRFSTIGRTEDLSPAVREALQRAERLTENNTGMRFLVALSYSGRSEIVAAARELARRAAAGQIDPAAIDEETFAAQLDTAGIPDPDLLIRTSGEVRVSNFLLWQIAYAELWVTPVLWPDFRRQHLYQGVIEYQSRDRRFGRVSSEEAKGAGLGAVARRLLRS